MIRIYDMSRRSGEATSTPRGYYLCERHREARKALGWIETGVREPRYPRAFGCDDCEAARTGTVMDRIIEADDAAKAKDEPEPVPTLPGQRKLFE